MHKEKEENGMIHIHHSSHDSYRTRELGIFENGLLDADVFLQVSLLCNSASQESTTKKCFYYSNCCNRTFLSPVTVSERDVS